MTKRTQQLQVIFSCLILVAVFIAYECHAQYPSQRDSDKRRSGRDKREGGSNKKDRQSVRIGRLTGIGRQTLVKTPQFRTRSQGGGKPASSEDWVQIAIEYDTFPDWIDTLTVHYQVMTMQKKSGEKIYGLYRQSVEYGDIEKGRDHVSTVFLRPATGKRFGLPVAVHVEFLVEGEVVAEENELEAVVKGSLPEDWWKNKLVLNNDKVTVRDGYLLSRKDTPFALINIDNYEVIR